MAIIFHHSFQFVIVAAPSTITKIIFVHTDDNNKKYAGPVFNKCVVNVVYGNTVVCEKLIHDHLQHLKRDA